VLSGLVRGEPYTASCSMSSPDTHLTTTGYALLGLLFTRPYTPYELSRQMKRDLHFCWPRAERGIYYEPKHLVERGLATATAERIGKRKRTVYSITPAGRRAFLRWLEEGDAAPPQLECEAILRATFAHRGSKEALERALDGLRDHAAEMRAQLAAQAREYARTGGPFPDQLHLIALTGRFLIDYTALLTRWTEWAQAQVRDWPSPGSAHEVPLDFAYEIFAELAPDSPTPAERTKTRQPSGGPLGDQ
jgi:PadR family transcriptional regulator, regulatory protein AphA